MGMIDPESPLRFDDGRVYDVLDLSIDPNWRPRIRYRCTMEVHRQGIDVVTISFSLRFYHLAYQNGRLPEMSSHDAAEFARRRVWQYLFENRQRWPKSRWLRPVIMEFK